MEQALERMLTETKETPATVAEVGEEMPLCGALPLPDEVVAPAARAAARAEERARATEWHLEDAVNALAAWRERLAALAERLASPPGGAVS
jgi:hypothetical protein